MAKLDTLARRRKAVITSRQRTPECMTFAFSTEVSLAVALARQIHADAADALDLGRRIGVGVETAARAVFQILDAARLGEIGAAARVREES